MIFLKTYVLIKIEVICEKMIIFLDSLESIIVYL